MQRFCNCLEYVEFEFLVVKICQAIYIGISKLFHIVTKLGSQIFHICVVYRNMDLLPTYDIQKLLNLRTPTNRQTNMQHTHKLHQLVHEM